MQFDTEVILPIPEELLQQKGLGLGGPVQVFIDSEVIRWSDPYCPFRTGALKNSANTATVLGQGEVVYATPYAKRLWYNPQFNFNGAPQRGAYWVDRMAADHMADITAGAEAIIRRLNP